MNKEAKERYTLIDRYILLKYLKTFILALALIIVIVITFDVSEKLDDFLKNSAPLNEIIFQYYMNFIPEFVNMYSPLFIFISVLFFTSKMAGNTEIIAILGSGISYRRLLQPYLHGSLILAIVVFILGNFVIPVSNRHLIEFEHNYIKTMTRSYYSNLHFQTDKNVQIYTEAYDATQRSAREFQRDIYDDEGRLMERITARTIQYDSVENKWFYSYLSKHVFLPKESLVNKPRGLIELDLKPIDFDRASIDITTLNTLDLLDHIEYERLRGSGAVKECKIELYQRLLNPLAVIVMTFIGVAISSRKTRGGIGVHLAIGISIAFGFIVFMKISTVFAINGGLSPFMAVLLPQLIFGVAAACLIKTAPK